MVMESRDSFVPLPSTPTAIHQTIIPYTPPPQPYIPPPTQGVPLVSTYLDAIHQAQNTVYQADTSIHQAINNSYSNTYNTYNQAHDTVVVDTTGIRDAVVQAVNSTQQHLSNDINNNISHVADLIDSTNRQAYSAITGSVDAIHAAINSLDTTISRQAAIDLSPIRQGIDDIANSISHTVSDSYDRQAAVVQNFMDFQARTIQQTLEAQHETLDTVSTAIHDSIQRVAAEIENSLPHEPKAEPGAIPPLAVATILILKVIMAVLGIPVNLDNESIADVVKQKGQYIKAVLDNAPADFVAKFTALAHDEYPDIDSFIAAFRTTGLSSVAIDLVLTILVGLGAAGKMSEIIAGPYFQKLQQLSSSQVNATLPSVPDLVRFLHWFDDFAPDFIATMHKLGFNDKTIANIQASSYQKLPPFEYLRNTFMFNKNVEEARKNIKVQGYTDDDIDLMLENYQGGFPPIADLIRMMVRDTFSDIAKEFGQFDEFPDTLMDYWAAQPIGDIWAKHYWAAHWNLPSTQQGFEMFHRGVINIDTLKLLMRANDIMPFWRDKLIDIAYNPVTRVDIRRLYNMGIWDRQKVYKAYLAGGYSPENAEYLTEFTTKSEEESDVTTHKRVRKLAEELIKKSFEREIINQGEAYNRLVSIGIKAEEAQITTQLWEFDRETDKNYKRSNSSREKAITMVKQNYEKKNISAIDARAKMLSLGVPDLEITEELHYADIRADVALKELKVKNVRATYVKHRIDRQQAIGELTAAGCSLDEADYLLTTFDLERENKDKQIPETEVNKLFKAGIITQAQYIDYMSTLGYDEQEITWLGILNAPVQTGQ